MGSTDLILNGSIIVLNGMLNTILGCKSAANNLNKNLALNDLSHVLHQALIVIAAKSFNNFPKRL